MKSDHRMYVSLIGRSILVALAILSMLCAGPAGAASEPGTVTIVLAGEPTDLDPGNSSSSHQGFVLENNIVEHLIELSSTDSSLMPRLATAWKQIDANTWQFVLRKGVKFHDGVDFDANAVVFSIKRLYDKRVFTKTGEKFFYGAGIYLDGKPLDKHMVEIKTNTTQPLMPILMSILPICSPNTTMEKLVRNPAGTGPYKFVKWDAGTQIVLERFDGYWGKQPQVKKVTYVWRGESSVRASMVAIGEGDLAPSIAPQDATRPDMDYSFPNSETTHMRIGGPWLPPLNDRRVRLALNYAVDRNAIRGSILDKNVIPAVAMVAPNIFGHNPDLKVWPYDPQKARQLLGEARKDGVPVDKEIVLVGRLAFFAGDQEVYEALMSMCRAVGLNVKLKVLESGAYRQYQVKPYNTEGPYLLVESHDNNKGDTAFTAFNKYHCNGTSSSMCDKKVDEVIEKAQTLPIDKERKALWQAVLKRVHEEVIPQVLLFHMVGHIRVGKRINFKPTMKTTNEVQVAQITFK